MTDPKKTILFPVAYYILTLFFFGVSLKWLGFLEMETLPFLGFTIVYFFFTFGITCGMICIKISLDKK